MRALASRALFASSLLASCGFASRALGAGSPPVVATAKGTPTLSVAFDGAGVLRAATCAAAACDVQGGTDLGAPPEVRALAESVRYTLVPIGRARRAVHVELADAAGTRRWEALVVAAGNAPRVLFAGYTGLVEGQEGERHGPMLVISDAEPDGSRRVVVGEQREDLSLCGRPAVLAPRVLDPVDLSLKPAKMQRLSGAERAAAPTVTATRDAAAPPASAPVEAPPAGPALLRALAATSAVGGPDALTDGDPETTWAENRGGSGRGEFVLLRAPRDVALTGLELTIRPRTANPAEAVAPRELWLAFDRELVHVVFAEDAWKAPGATYSVILPRPVTSECLALVTESGWTEGPDVRVTLAEVRARTALDGVSPTELAGALAGGGDRARAAASVLSHLGAAGVAAVNQVWPKLDEQGQVVALDVLDPAPCADAATSYVRGLLGSRPGIRSHARDRLTRCADAAAAAIEAALLRAHRRARPLLLDQLALSSPARALEVIPLLFAHASDQERRLFRAALGLALRDARLAPALAAKLGDTSLPEVATLDLLRAVGDRTSEVPVAVDGAIARLGTATASFRTRWLLLGPASRMPAGTAAARWLATVATDPDARLRMGALRVLPDAEGARAALLRGLEDGEVRVRQAAVEAAGRLRASYASDAVARRVRGDPWPLVRISAARSAPALGPSPALDQALAAALDHDSPRVRIALLEALGARHAVAQVQIVRDHFREEEELPEVRTAAALALGDLCDRESQDDLTERTAVLAQPLLPTPDRGLAQAALASLAALHPPDLAQRLAPLLDARAPAPSRAAAQRAIAGRGTCPAR